MTTMTSEELEKIFMGNDPDEIERALAEISKEDVSGESSSASAFHGQNSAPAEKEQATAISSKNGEHIIPFEVLERERAEKAALREKYEQSERERQQLQNEAAAAQARQAKIDLLEKQLKEQGLEPKKLPDEVQLTDELLAQLDEYGDIGEVTRALALQTKHQQAQLEMLQRQLAPAGTSTPASQTAPAPSEGHDAGDVTTQIWADIAKVPGLTELMKDPDSQQILVAIDAELDASPQWQGRPAVERFAHVKQLFDKQKMPAQSNVPFSMNGTPGATSTVNAPSIVDTSSGHAAINHLDSLSDADVKRLIALHGF